MQAVQPVSPADGLRRDAVITLIVAFLAFLAYDDITTGRESSFVTEQIFLTGAAIWCVGVAWRLLRRGRIALAIGSFAAVGLAAVAQPWLGSVTEPGSPIAHAIALGSIAWFVILCGALLRAWAVPNSD